MLKNGFCSISFEKISVLDSYFIRLYIIIYHIGQVCCRVKSANYYENYGPFSTSFFAKCLVFLFRVDPFSKGRHKKLRGLQKVHAFSLRTAIISLKDF